ncbi:MAG: PolC-type DNA polymerase III [Lachnospiraceae bacterium]|nr:PolC-type DNA polymerase III [Lachnospiraceae bacterium]
MAETPFKSAFPNLKVSDRLDEFLDEVVADRVTLNPARDFLHIYIHSRNWIGRGYIEELEKAVKAQFFPEAVMTVKVVEHFRLSASYHPENFYEVYRPSMLEELKAQSPALHQTFLHTHLSFDGDARLFVTMPPTLVSRQKADELQRYLHKVFNERAGFDLTVEVRILSDAAVKKTFNEAAYEDSLEKAAGYFERRERRLGAGRSYQPHRNAPQTRPSGETAGHNAADEEMAMAAAAAIAESYHYQDARQAVSREELIEARVQSIMDKNLRESEKGEEPEKKLPSRQENPGRRRHSFTPADPNVIYGKDFEGEPVPISELGDDPHEVIIRGEVFAVTEQETRSGRIIFSIAVTDGTDSIRIKFWLDKEELDDFRGTFSKGKCFIFRGMMDFDAYDKETIIRQVFSIKRSSSIRPVREDTAPVKRVELHCHTKMSDMDGVSSATSIIARAYSWGHKALAITDHGVVQAFPEALHAFGGKGGIPADADMKIIYGMEAYLVDDTVSLVTGADSRAVTEPVVVFSTVTTGRSPYDHDIIEIGAVLLEDGQITGTFKTLVNPGRPIPFSIERTVGIGDDMVADAPAIGEALKAFLAFAGDHVLAAYEADYEMSFLSRALTEAGLPVPATYVDIPSVVRYLLPNIGKIRFDRLCKDLKIPCSDAMRAFPRARSMALVYTRLQDAMDKAGIQTLRDLNKKGRVDDQRIRNLPYYHAIILIQNETGRRNLYKMVSESHLRYYKRRPRLPKSLMTELREGLIYGSACSAGELYQAILKHKSDAEIASIVDFYDYLEIQPDGNNEYLVRDHLDGIETLENIREINRRICKLGEQFRKPVCATCDVHFLNPEDEIYRRIIQVGHGYKDEAQPPLYLRTTDEMLAEFAYLGDEKAYEVVVTNTNKIADRLEKISPIHPDKCPPEIPHSEEDLTEMCYKKAHRIYGDPLPEIVATRLEKELHSICSNGYSVMYMIAQKLVAKSMEDGYLVGSRGSVGSSFVATMSDITEVNPLPPHYYCPQCHYVDFDSEEVRKHAGGAGFDLPDRNCPNCGEKLKKDGFDIPFETFLGFKGNKEPDIDLNFSGDEQGVAQAYTEVIFGKGQTFKAGTIGTVADKTAYGYAMHYFADREEKKRPCELERLSQGCVGVRRTTGQHPGGVIVVPKGMDINWFTPVQHPADDMSSNIITTHFDYHSIDKNLLKLDILGHDDPTMIRMLKDLTGTDPLQVPMDDEGVRSLFRSTEALGITPEDIGGCELGTLGIPEFGTDFVMGMLKDTRPSTLAEFIRISGLSHGTDVWLGNAQEYIRNGDCTLSTAICTRDDIMLYLIAQGLEPEHAFKIMEAVRKGKGLKPDQEEEMREHGVPDWYIESCKKIKYMFPKAHAAAYVMNAFRIAYYKVHYPLAYYAAYFSIRSTTFNYELMCLGLERLQYHIDDFERRKNELTANEKDTLRDMRICREMYARGFEFHKMDLTQAHARDFRIIDGKLMPAINTIGGLGDTQADAVEAESRKGPFLSKDDFRIRTKVSKTIIDQLENLGILSNMPESNQISLFDLA